MFYRNRHFRTPRSRIAQSDSKIACRYSHFQVDYEFCAYNILFSSWKVIECPPFIDSITGLLDVGGLQFFIPMPPCALLLRRGVHNCCGADERLNLRKIEFKIGHVA